MLRASIYGALLVSTMAVAAPLDKFGWFSDVVGWCWEGALPDGETRHTHCYTAQFDEFIRGVATLSGNVGGVTQDLFFGDSVFAWDENDQRMTYYLWGSGGAHGRYEAYYEHDDLIFPVPDDEDPDELAYRSVWRRLDNRTLEVERQVPKGSGWTTELTVVYERKPLNAE